MTLTILATPTSRLLTTTVRATSLLLLATIRVAMILVHLALTRIPAMAALTTLAAVTVRLAMIQDLLARQVALMILAAAMAGRLLATILDHPAVTTQDLLATEVDNVQQVM